MERIGFIGAGNMAEALARGLAAAGAELYASDPAPARRAALAPLAREVLAENRALLDRVDILLLAVKPQVMAGVLAEIGPAVPARMLVISIAAGIETDLIRHFIPASPLVRAMPNTPCLIGKGVSVLFAPWSTGREHRSAAERVFRACGATAWVAEEELLDAVTALSGSGPAYFYRFCEALAAAGEALGLPPELAGDLARRTFTGAAALLETTGEAPESLRAKVTSPGGTTEAALRVFEEGRLGELADAAVDAASRRAGELRRKAWEAMP